MNSENRLYTDSILKRISNVEPGSTNLATDLEYTYLDPLKAEAQLFMKYDIHVLVNYLENCHKDYTELMIPNILNSFNLLLKNASECVLLQKMGPILIYGFKEDVLAHFNYEERFLFPYALSLDKGDGAVGYSTKEFQKNHPEHIVDIERLLHFFEMLSNELDSFMSYRILVKRLSDLKIEFDIHGLIEDKVLIPKLKNLE